MKTTKRKGILLFAAVLLLAFVFAASSSAVQAAEEPSLSVEAETYELAKPAVIYFLPISGVKKTSQVSAVKSSNKKIATVKLVKYDDEVGLDITPKKLGKSTVTCKVKYGNKTKKIKLSVTVKKYANILKSIKVNGKSYLSAFKKTFWGVAKISNLKAKRIQVKAKSDWELVRIERYISSGKSQVIQNGGKIGITKGTLSLLFRNKKTQEYRTYHFSINE